MPDTEKFVENLARLENFSAVVLEENGGISSIVAADMLRKCCDKEIFLKISCRDRNRIALHSELVTTGALGLLNVVLVDGAHPIQTQFPAAKPVYELDPLMLLNMLKRNSPEFGNEINPPLSTLQWKVGIYVGGSTSADVSRAKKLAAAGADLFFVRSLEAIHRLKDLTDKPIILSFPLEEAKAISEVVREAELAGASGVNMVVRALDKVLDGYVTSR